MKLNEIFKKNNIWIVSGNRLGDTKPKIYHDEIRPYRILIKSCNINN